MRPGPRSEVLRPRRHPRMDPSPLPIDSRELCVTALAAYSGLHTVAQAEAGRDPEIELRHERGRRLLLARAAAEPWVVPPPRRERLRQLLETVGQLDGRQAGGALLSFPPAFLAVLERRQRSDDGAARRRRDDPRSERSAQFS